MSNKAQELGCCKVESLINIDERGQMVLPKEIRERAGIKPGDKLALITFAEDTKKIHCMVLINAEDLQTTIKEILDPMVQEIVKNHTHSK